MQFIIPMKIPVYEVVVFKHRLETKQIDISFDLS